MAAELLTKRLKSIVECSICLDKFSNPKQLKCNHHFCKQCLEGIIEFKGDGSARIICPLRCANQTLINVDQTIDDLSASYEVKGMLEVFETEDELLDFCIPKCTYDTSCTKDVSLYCCDVMLCKTCFVNHKKTGGADQHRRNLNLSFNKQENKLKVLCDEHSSDCTHLCIDNKFLCIYCMSRNKQHEAHAKNTIDTEVTLIKEALLYDSSKKENVEQFVKLTKENKLLTETKLDEILQARKKECLAQYNDFLNKQEEILKSKFQHISNNHMEQYPNIVDEYYEEKLRKSDVELALQKEEILHVICRNESKSLVNTETVSISETFDFRDDCPLGDIHVTVGEAVLICNTPVMTLKHDMKLGYKASEVKETNVNSINSMNSMNSICKQSSSGNSDSVVTKSYDGSYSQGDDDIRQAVETGDLNNRPVPCARVQPHELLPHSVYITNVIRNLSTVNVQAFFDIKIDEAPAGRLIMNLFVDVVPDTCRNFIQLCTHEQGFGYKGNKFHFVDPRRYCIGGDITEGDGSGGKSIYGEKFPCENYILKHNDKGMLSMVNSGGFTKSMFFITTTAMPGNDGYTVVFGKVTEETYFVVEKIASVGGRSNPNKEIVIVNCGVL